MKKFIQFILSCLLSEGIFAQPTIISFAPTSGPVGTVVTITGANFGLNPDDNIVYFGATKATVTAANSTSLNVTVPAGATYQPFTVTTNELTTYSSKPFIVTFPGGGSAFTDTSFGGRKEFVAGNSPQGIDIGDLDGDGKIDIVTVEFINNSGLISVFRNTSTKEMISFANKADYMPGNARRVAISDLDGDGKLDLAVTNWGIPFGVISIFRNTSVPGTISFADKVTYQGGAYEIAIADLDGDGKPDIASSNWGYPNGFVSILRNTSVKGNISFAAKIDYATDTSSQKIAIGDLNGDGKPDLVINCTRSHHNTFSLFKNTSTKGTIALGGRVDYLCSATSFAIGDMDGDDKPDLCGGMQIGFGSIFRNISTNDTILFEVEKAFSGYEQSKMTDMNGDGYADIIGLRRGVSNEAVCVAKNVSVLGDILFEPGVNYAAAPGPYGLSIGDFNGDGEPDIAVVNSGSNTFSIFKNQINSTLCTAPTSLKVTNVVDTAARIAWVLPKEMASTFRLRYRAVGTATILTRRVIGMNNHVILKSLSPNTTYEWQIRSNCTEDTSGWVKGPDFTTSSAFASASGYALNDVKVISKTSLQITPNPNKGNFTIQMLLPAIAASTTLALYNEFGQLVWQQNLGNIGGTVQRTVALESKISAGFYTLTIQRSDIKLNQKIMINK